MRALKLTPVFLNEAFKEAFPESNAGTTATIAMILDGKIWTANVGDSRTVLDNNGTPIQLSEDAKPSNARYQSGIKRRGGFVCEGGRVNGNLAVARAIGDKDLPGISARPKITVKDLSEVDKDSHLILCSDGIYDVASTGQVVEAVHQDKKSTVKELALNLTTSATEWYSSDNVTAMVIKIK